MLYLHDRYFDVTFHLFKPNYKNYATELIDKSISDFIPYLSHYNEDTLITKNGDLISVIQVIGFSFETADDSDLDGKKANRNNLFKGMDNPKFNLTTHTIRSKCSAYPGGEFEKGGFAEMMNNEWKKKQSIGDTFINEHFISIMRKAPGQTTFFSELISTLRGDEISGKEIIMKEMFNEFEEMRNRLFSGLMPYKPTMLGVRVENGKIYSEIAEFLGRLVNVGRKQEMLIPRISLDKYLSNTRLYFGDRMMEVVGPGHRKFAGIVSIKEYRPSTFPGMLDGFLQLPFEIVITQSYSFIARLSAISKMQLQQRRLVQAEDVAVSQIQEINDAMDAATGGVFAFGTHHCTVMCLAENIKALDSYLSQAVVEFANCGISAVRENINLEASFWAQLPGNASYAIRACTINTQNLASFVSFHNYPSGKPTKNHWGDAITVFSTTSKTPYYFNFHVRDIGHSLIIGPTGAGKTVIMNMACCQMQKYPQLRTFFFDKDRGAEIFIKAIGGKHTFIDPSRPCGLNPLQMADNGRNKTFLTRWLRMLVTANGETISSADLETIAFAVDGCYKLPKEDRLLRNIAPFLGLEKPGSLASRLKIWHSNGAKANLFDNETDDVDFSRGRVFGFEMAELFRDEIILVPTISYLFHRIESSLDGTPTCMFIDEAWSVLRSPEFQTAVQDWLKVWRKLNGMVVMATQSVEDASKSKISDTLIQQTSTQLFLPNLKATSAYRDVFMLSEREFELVKNTDPSSRYFLVKQDGHGVIVRADLSGMSDVINILSGRAETAILLDEVMAKIGDDPREWLPVFLKTLRQKK